MTIVLRIVGFLAGAALAVVGFLFWMLSNDFPDGESAMKALGVGGMAFGLALCLVALLARSSKTDGGSDAPSDADGSSRPAL
ncbi:MAG: hypothetical protein M3285_08430 [Actinomycetota bacterium]|nr:hypothetical protein [Actinomycetota bacterium]